MKVLDKKLDKCKEEDFEIPGIEFNKDIIGSKKANTELRKAIHELNNTLAGILCASQLITKQNKVDSETGELITLITESSKRASISVKLLFELSQNGIN